MGNIAAQVRGPGVGPVEKKQYEVKSQSTRQ